MNLSIQNLEAFPWVALNGLLRETKEIYADISLNSGESYPNSLINLSENENIIASRELVIQTPMASSSFVTLKQSNITEILIN
jgi:hypothetical protein